MKPKAPGALCSECPLQDRPFVPGFGPKKADYVVCGEAPGQQEVKQGKPFVGAAGKLLNMVLRHHGLDRSDVYVTNAVLCRPPLKDGKNTSPNKKAMDCCHDRLVREVSQRQPRRIIAAGNAASKSLLRTNQGITDSRIGGPKVWPEGDAQIIPTFHPAAALRNPDFFPSIVSDVKKAVRIEIGWEPTKYKVVDDVERGIALLHKAVNKFNRLGLDVEVDHLSERHSRFTPDWLCIGISHAPGKAVVFDERVCYSRKFQRELRKALSDRSLTWCYQNGIYDTQLLWSFAPEARVGADSMLMHYALNEIKGTHDLEQLGAEFLGAPSYKTEMRSHLPKKDASLRHLPAELLHRYNATDVDVTHRLIDVFQAEMEKDRVERPYRELLLPGAYSFALMQYHGVKLDIPYLKDEIGDKILNLANQREQHILEIVTPYIDKIASYNPNFARSHKQIAEAFEVMYGIRLKSTDEDNLAPYVKKVPLAKAILDYREVQKLYSTYVKGPLKRLEPDRRLHPEFKLHGTETGRTSSSPNIQNWPLPEPDNPDAWAMRDAVIAPDGHSLLSADYAGIELVVAAYLSRDENLLAFIRSGRSFHKMVAAEVFGENYSKREYRDTKAINFGAGLYDETPSHLAYRLRCSLRRARQIQNTFHDRAPGIKPFQAEIRRQVVEQGELVSIFGRKRRFWLITDQNRKHIEKEGINFPIQSAAHDFTLTSLNRIVERFDIRPDTTNEVFPIIEMHDSLTFEIEESILEDAAVEIRKIMEDTAITDTVPTRVEMKVGKRWGSEIDFEPQKG